MEQIPGSHHTWQTPSDMTTKTVLLVLFLAAIAICSSSPILDCLCLHPVKAVNWLHVVEVKEYGPRSYCNKREVIVIMKSRKSRCVDPSVTIPQHLLQANRQRRKAHASRLESTGSQQTAASRIALPPPEVML